MQNMITIFIERALKILDAIVSNYGKSDFQGLWNRIFSAPIFNLKMQNNQGTYLKLKK